MTPPGARRGLPSMDALLRSEPGRRAQATFGRPLLKRCLAEVLAGARAAAAGGQPVPDADDLLARAVAAAARAAGGPVPVINATGVILHTGLGRAPLPASAFAAIERAARGYSDLEIDLATGGRGRRSSRAETLLVALTGAEAALVVNNGAAALLLALAALAKGKQVLVSRGELVEIGGGFRIPDILAASGAKLVEVGTTNRTRVADFREGWTERTAMVLKVHPSNYRVVGFAESPTAAQLASLARTRGVPFVHDLGSGLLEEGAVADEPAAVAALADGADLALFSGDKLLGGAQAGIAVGRADLVERMRRHPIARAVRIDKLQVVALEA
ncbi:MAG: L-seryl-tRNA(Sec) selenium transferase, partial [Actinomycetota bacterium]